jgi:hypothetical protein
VPNGWEKMIAPADRADIAESQLHDLNSDMGERTNIAAAHPEMMGELMKKIEWARNDIGDDDRKGRNARFFDHDDPPRPDLVGKSQDTSKP